MHEYLYENVEERYDAGRPKLLNNFRMHTNSLQYLYQSFLSSIYILISKIEESS